MPRRKIDKAELMEKVLELVKATGKPVSIDYVAFHLGISWHVARAILLVLVAKRELKMMDTTKGYIFYRGDASQP